MPRTNSANTYRWCDTCRRSFSHEDAPDSMCPVCGSATRDVGKLAALARGFMANEFSTTDLRARHRQLIRLIWTRNGMGERYYRVIAPDVPYSKFEARVTDLLCQGADEGWVTFVLPVAPSSDEAAYRVEFADDDRFVREMQALFAPVSLPGGEV